jgi:hypothetical protein
MSDRLSTLARASTLEQTISHNCSMVASTNR